MNQSIHYFFCRLIPPRSTFPADITPAEAAGMGKHVDYLRGLAAQGALVVAGPVADPNGAWGLAVLRGESEAAVQALLDADPIILADFGFRYERTRMMSAITRT